MENLNDIKKELIEGTLKEGDTIQIKPRLQRGNEDQLARLLAALSNTYGGYLIIGVQENENRCEIIGLAETKNELEDLFNHLRKDCKEQERQNMKRIEQMML